MSNRLAAAVVGIGTAIIILLAVIAFNLSGWGGGEEVTNSFGQTQEQHKAEVVRNWNSVLSSEDRTFMCEMYRNNPALIEGMWVERTGDELSAEWSMELMENELCTIEG